MLQTILFILKIILWIILAILGILLLLILLVLFAPISYKVDAQYKGTAKVKAKISFLILSVRVSFDQEIKKLDYAIRVAGIKLRTGDKKTNKSKTNKPAEVSESEGSPSEVSAEALEPVASQPEVSDEDDWSSIDELQSDIVTDGTEHSISKEQPVPDSADSIDAESVDNHKYEEFDLWDNDIDRDVPKEEQKLLGRIKAFVKGIAARAKGIKNKVDSFDPEAISKKLESKTAKLKKNIEKFKRFWNLSCTVKTRKYLKKYFISLVRHIGPRKIKGYVKYGFGDPCKTGQITGYLSLLPFVYSKHFSLQPDFYEKLIEADVHLKGRIHIGYILRIVLNINIWRTIIVARKLFRGRK